MNYPTSTQHNAWIFTEEQLAEKRRHNRQNSLDIIKKARAESEVNGGEVVNGGEAAPPGKQKRPKAISVEDELKLIRYYSGKVQDVCKGFSFPHKVQAAALLFLKRFYLSFSVLDHDPKDIFLTAIYLACKVEEAYIGAEQFCRVVKQDEETVLRNELTVLKGLNFDLITYAPYRSIEGFLADLEEVSGQEAALDAGLRGLVESGVGRVRSAARAAADALMLTDAPLLFHPGHLALAALRSGVRKARVSFSPYLQRVAERQAAAGGRPPADVAAELTQTLARIDEFGQQGTLPVDQEQVKKIDSRRLRYHNELLDPSSDAYKRAAAERERRAQQAHLLKAAARQAEKAGEEAQLLGHVQSKPDPAAVSGLTEALNAAAEPPTKRQRLDG